MTQRIAKEIARRGYCSRRQAEAFIAQGEVTVNGAVLKEPGTRVGGKDIICIKGEVLRPAQETKLWAFHKPLGCLTTRDDPFNRPTIFDYLVALDKSVHDLPSHLIPIGRLDFNSEGLLLLTNDGEFAAKMMHPETKVPRCYHVDVFGNIQESDFASLAKGVTVDGVTYRNVQVKILKRSNLNHRLEITLYEGKNREIRKLMTGVCDLKVKRLKRISYGHYHLGDLKPGHLRAEKISQGKIKGKSL